MTHGAVVDALRDGPRTVDELAVILHTHGADIRSALAILVYADRLVTCDSEGRFYLGSPPDTWPRISKAHP